MIDSRNSIGTLRSATRRTIIFVLVAVSLAVNVAAGAFAGYAHAHDHEHAEKHAHQHRSVTVDLHDHDHGDDESDDVAETVGSPGSSSGQHETLHEHGAFVVFALEQTGSLSPLDGGSSPGLIICQTTVSDVKHPLERPPRRA